MTSTDISISQVINFSSKDANTLQSEIEVFTKKIEHEKINLRLCEERHQKQLETYNSLCGKPNPKTKEQKEKERKEKDKNKYDKSFLKINGKHDGKALDFEKSVSNNQVESERLTSEINSLLLENKDLRKKIEDVRKEKLAVSNLLESLKGHRDSFKNRYEDLLRSNEEAMKRMKNNDIERVKKEGHEKRIDFEENRDGLEEKFHEIIEENIKRSRDQKKEALKKRIHYNLKQEDEQAKLLAEEDISDRTPILDVLIEKWKFYNKYKKQMLEKYTKNSYAIKEAFENMRKYLGIDDYQELPIVLEKMEEQMSSIEMFISKLTNDLDLLEERKRVIEFKIQELTMKTNKTTQTKNAFVESKKNHISKLRSYIKDLKEDIERKRIFFTKLQPSTEQFLTSLQSTYISEYLPEKIAINKEVSFSESNVVEILANVEDYQKLYEEFQVNNQGLFDKKSDVMVNKDIEKLRSEMRAKLDQFRRDGIGSNFYSNFKGENKTQGNFDETIKKMADEIVKVVNSQNVVKSLDGKKKK